MTRMRSPRLLALVVLAAAVAAIPAAGVPKERPSISDRKLAHLSQIVAARYYANHPELAPPEAGQRLAAIDELAARSTSARLGARRSGAPDVRNLFNDDVFGLPQNEESVTACRTNSQRVLSGTNDYRGLLDPEQNFTGWHYSNDGGRSLANEGLLPPADGLPSGGDPVDVAGVVDRAGADAGCGYLYAASLAYDPTTVPFGENGIAVYRTTPATLESCPTGANPANPACWPTGRLVAIGTPNLNPTPQAPGTFLDKEWMDVGLSAGVEQVWVTYSEFTNTGFGPTDFTAEIFAVRCDRDLVQCTDPIPISVDDFDVQFSFVTVGPDGRVYVSWSEIIGELPNDPDCPNPDPATGECPQQIFVHKLRVAEPTPPGVQPVFGPERIVYVEEKPIPFGGFLHANDFRVATVQKNEVALVKGDPRIFVTWDACRYAPLSGICEEPFIRLTWSDDGGATWTDPIEVSSGGDNYFPFLDWNDRNRKGALAFTWFSNLRDRQFHNRQDVEYVVVDAEHPRRQLLRQRATRELNESEADPVLGGFFIGDYIEVSATRRVAYVGFNANYRKVALLGVLGAEGIPIPQQDNYLVRKRVPQAD
jgi:hypothetical protein